MKYFIVNLRYTASPERRAEILDDHRAYLDRGYAKGWFLASGPQNPKVGGMIVARAPSREDLEALLADDPFQTQNAAEYSIVEFEPVKRHPEMGSFFEA